jgi:peptidoglycan/LPS O-acetylase OafA/YrhL
LIGQGALLFFTDGDVQANPKPLPPYIPELDGIRAIAVLMVVMMHVLAPDDQSSNALLTVAPRVLTGFIGHGWLGVGLFFVLSGFLITGILLDTRESPHYLETSMAEERSGFFRSIFCASR